MAEGFIRVVFRGPQNFETTSNAIVEGARLVKRTGILDVMFDFQFADPKGYFAETVRHAEDAQELGLPLELRIAFFSPTQFDVVDFMATVAVNRGYTARAFSREEDALEWLRTPAH